MERSCGRPSEKLALDCACLDAETDFEARERVAGLIYLADQGVLDLSRSRAAEQQVLDLIDKPLTTRRSYHSIVRLSPSTVIFDYGNVLSQPQPVADIQAMAAILDLPLTEFSELYWRFRIEYDARALEPVTYWNRVAQTGFRTLIKDQTAQLIEIDSRSWSHPEPVMAQWARDLRASGLRTAILSNMPTPVRDHILRCSWLPEFDARTFSCEVGVCKPEPAIYWDCLNKLGVKPSEVLFLDDRESNVRAADSLGMHAILFTDASSAAQEIERRFSMPVTLE